MLTVAAVRLSAGEFRGAPGWRRIMEAEAKRRSAKDLLARKQRAQESGERFGRFLGNVAKGVIVGLGLIFAAILILWAF